MVLKRKGDRIRMGYEAWFTYRVHLLLSRKRGQGEEGSFTEDKGGSRGGFTIGTRDWKARGGVSNGCQGRK